MGRLEERVKDRALELIDSGADFRRWEELGGSTGDLRRRARTLDGLRARLGSPQRSPARIRPPRRETSPFEPGEVFSYRLESGPTVLLRVIELLTDRGGSSPSIGLVDWTGERPPTDTAALSALPLRRHRQHGEEDSATYLVFGGGETQFPRDRVELLARGLPEIDGGMDDLTLEWHELDEEVEKRLGLRDDPLDTPFNYSLESPSRIAAE